MQDKELVLSDMKALVESCDEYVTRFEAFKRHEKLSSDVINEVSSKVTELRDEWHEKYESVVANGFEEDGELSYATIGYKLSLAYKRLSEILNELRFGLERIDMMEKYERMFNG